MTSAQSRPTIAIPKAGLLCENARVAGYAMKTLVLLLMLMMNVANFAQTKATGPGSSSKPALSQRADSSQAPDAMHLKQMAARFTPTPLRVDTSQLSTGDRQALPKLIEAARILDDIFMEQYWSGDRALYQRLQKDPTDLGRTRLHYFWINKGPWDELNESKAFLPGVPAHKLPGANFYPEDMAKPEFENWLSIPHANPDSQGAWCYSRPSPDSRLPTLVCGGQVTKEDATRFFSTIRRAKWYTWSSPNSSAIYPTDTTSLAAFPFSDEYRPDLEKVAALLHQAAALTDNASLKTFLTSRADAFLSNDYYESDLAWMDLDAPLDITIGPYETYNDELFGYKAAFEAYVNLRDDRETTRLAVFAQHLQEIENNLPEDPQYRNPQLGQQAPIRVVNEIFSAGDGAHGVQTAAYNLPNDERVVKEKGSKRVMLKNVQEAKFRSVLVPIATRVLARNQQPDLSFEMFFTHILAHELMHGLGPHQITVDGRATNVRQELKDVYSAIEEAKADVTGLFALQYMMDHASEMKLGNLLPADEAAQRQLYITYLASAFRSLRFGLNDAHGKGMAVQFNYLSDKGAFVERPDGSFAVNVPAMKGAVQDFAHDLLTVEATGDYAAARQMLDTLGVVRPSVQRVLERLQGIPTDIEPLFVTADEMTGKIPKQDSPARKRTSRKPRK
jgi:hypothetical protein